MLKCKNCNKPLTKFDKDLCPYCGTRNPIDETSTETVDVTQFIDNVQEIKENKAYKRMSRKVYVILLMTLGIFSAHLFYLKRYSQAMVLLITNGSFIGGCGYVLSILNFLPKDLFFVYWMISLGMIFLIYFIMGLTVAKYGEPVDRAGQVLK